MPTVKVSMTVHKNILLLEDGEQGIVDYPSTSIHYGQPAFNRGGKIVVFNPQEGRFIQARNWNSTRIQVKLDQKKVVYLPC